MSQNDQHKVLLFSSLVVALAAADTCSDCTAVVNAIQAKNPPWHNDYQEDNLKGDDADTDLNDLPGEAHV